MCIECGCGIDYNEKRIMFISSSYRLMLSLAVIVSLAANGMATSSNSTGRFGHINVVVEKFALTTAAASKMTELVKTLNKEFADNADENQHIVMSMYQAFRSSMPRIFHRRAYNQLRDLPDTTEDNEANFIQRIGIWSELNRNLISHDLLWYPPSGDYSPTLKIQTPKSILIVLMDDMVTNFNTLALALFVKSMRSNLTIMVYHPTRDARLDFKEPAVSSRQPRAPGDPLADYFYTDSDVAEMISDIHRELTVTQRDCVNDVTYRCGERGVGTTQVDCVYLKDVAVKTRGQGPVGKPCNTGRGKNAGFNACNSSCSAVTCPSTCCDDSQPFTVCGATSTKTQRIYKHGGACSGLPAGQNYVVHTQMCQRDTSCHINTDCIGPEICQNLKCINPTTCNDQDDCPGRLECDANGICSTLPPKDLHCTENKDCHMGIEVCHAKECRRTCNASAQGCQPQASDCQKNGCKACHQNEQCIEVGDNHICTPVGKKLDGEKCSKSTECMTGVCLKPENRTVKVCLQHCKYCEGCGLKCKLLKDDCPTPGEHKVCETNPRQDCTTGSQCTGGVCAGTYDDSTITKCHRNCTPCLQGEVFETAPLTSGALMSICRWSLNRTTHSSTGTSNTSSGSGGTTLSPYSSTLAAAPSEFDRANSRVNPVFIIISALIPLYLLVSGITMIRYSIQFFNNQKPPRLIKPIKVKSLSEEKSEAPAPKSEAPDQPKSPPPKSVVEHSVVEKTIIKTVPILVPSEKGPTPPPKSQPKTPPSKPPPSPPVEPPPPVVPKLNPVPQQRNRKQFTKAMEPKVKDENVYADLPTETVNRTEGPNTVRFEGIKLIRATQNTQKEPENAKSLKQNTVASARQPEKSNAIDASTKKGMIETNEIESVNRSQTVKSDERTDKAPGGVQSIMNRQGKQSKAP